MTSAIACFAGNPGARKKIRRANSASDVSSGGSPSFAAATPLGRRSQCPQCPHSGQSGLRITSPNRTDSRVQTSSSSGLRATSMFIVTPIKRTCQILTRRQSVHVRLFPLSPRVYYHSRGLYEYTERPGQKPRRRSCGGLMSRRSLNVSYQCLTLALPSSMKHGTPELPSGISSVG
jgi:hypothetical protein